MFKVGEHTTPPPWTVIRRRGNNSPWGFEVKGKRQRGIEETEKAPKT